MDDRDMINELAAIFTEMVGNADGNDRWKNIPLAKRAFAIMTDELADDFTGELTPLGRASLLDKMLDVCDMRNMPRFVLDVTRYQDEMLRREPDGELQDEVSRRLDEYSDFIDPDVTMEDYVKRYHRILKFDPVERTQRWEDIAYEVEKETARRTADMRRGMGFCHYYWHVKAEVLEQYGIEWRSPSMMNPGVMFD